MDPVISAKLEQLRQYASVCIQQGVSGMNGLGLVSRHAATLGVPIGLIPQQWLHEVMSAPAGAQRPAAAAAVTVAQQQLASAAAHRQPAAFSAAQQAAAGLTSAELTLMRMAELARQSTARAAALQAPQAPAKKQRTTAAGEPDYPAPRTAGAAAAAAGGAEAMVELDEEEEGGGQVGTDENEDGHTYSEYRAMQIRQMHPDIMGHPDPLVETASLASVPLPPPSFRHSLHDCVEGKLLSDAQLETVVYANMKFQGRRLPDGKRAGFFLGDGAGVGKGRQIAALIKQHWSDGGRRALWVSVSSDLRMDAARDLADVKAAHIPVCPERGQSVPTGKGLSKFGDGCLFVTYSLLISGLGGKKAKAAAAEEALAGVASVEQGRINVPAGSRLAQIMAWLKGSSQPPLIVFDECHKAKNLLPTAGSQSSQTARAVVELQEQLGAAKILYSSATGASEPRNLAYMTRLGLWGFKDAVEMIDLLSKSKLGALELAAMSLKATGTYLSRTLSYAGAEFALGYVDVEPAFKIMYDRATMLWTLIWKIVQAHPRLKKLQGVFWAANQRFYKQMLMASKVPACANMAKEAMQNGMAVVIGLQSTGEANTELMKELNDSFDDLVSAPRMVLEQYIRSQFPLDKGDASQAELDSLEFQVFGAVNSWRTMLPASEVVAQKAEAQEVAHAAQLMGLRVNKNERQTEEDVIRMRLKMKKAAAEDEERRVEQRLKDKQEQWGRRRAAQERRLRLAKQEAGKGVQAAELALAKVQATAAKAAPAQGAPADAAVAAVASQQAQRAAMEGSSSEEEEEPLASGRSSGKRRTMAAAAVFSSDDEEEAAAAVVVAAPGQRQQQAVAAGGKPGSAKRKAAMLEDSDSDGSPASCKENATTAGQRGSQRLSAGRLRVVDSDDEEDEDVPLSARPPLAPRSANGNARAPLAFKHFDEPLEIDLTGDDDIACMICSRLDDEASMLLCDGCDRGWHTLCARLKRMPSSPTWFCAGCTPGQQEKAAAAAAGQLQQRNRLHKQAAVAAAAAVAEPQPLDSDDDSDIFAAPRVVPVQATGGQKMQLLAAERKLESARRALRTAELELEAFAEETAAGPPATPARQTRGGASVQQQHQGRNGSTSFDPTVRNMQLGAAKLDGYRHAVKVHDLTDLPDELPAEQGTSKKRRGEGGKGKDKGRRDAEVELLDDDDDDDEEEEEGEDELAEMDEDYRVPQADVNGDISPQLMRMRGWLLRIVQAMELPPNPLDQLVELLGGEEHVAELTGRKGYVCMDDDRAVYKQRGGDGPQKDMNLREKDAFMQGRKFVAIISDAASTGISLQADRRVANQRRRCHITLELPWSADKAVQQFGRSHRANQVSAPLYRILTVPVGGEYRFASAAAKRLASLGALLRGDRNAIGAGSELKAFDIDNAHGEKALVRVLHDICGDHGSKPMPGVKVPVLPRGMALPEFMSVTGRDIREEQYCNETVPPFFQYMRTKLASVGVLETSEAGDASSVTVPSQKAKLKVPRFLNRLLGMQMADQELLFQYYTDTLDATIAQLKSEGKFDTGIVTIKGRSCTVVGKRVIYQDAASGGEVHHVELSMDRGVPWDAALTFKAEVEDKLEEQEAGRKHLSGFYVQKGRDTMAGGRRRPSVILATEIIKSASNIRNTRFHIQRPNTGSTTSKTLAEMEDARYTRLSEKDAEPLWKFWFEYTEAHCIHGDNCSQRRRGEECRYGMRKDDTHLVCGAVLPIWQRLERLHNNSGWGKRRTDGNKWPLRVVKCIQEDGSPLVGVEAVCREELDFFEASLKLPEVDPAVAAAAAKQARAGRGPAGRAGGNAAAMAAMYGGVGGASGSDPSAAFGHAAYRRSGGGSKKKRHGGQARHFR